MCANGFIPQSREIYAPSKVATRPFCKWHEFKLKEVFFKSLEVLMIGDYHANFSRCKGMVVSLIYSKFGIKMIFLNVNYRQSFNSLSQS